jgi:hypothetical protein
MKVNYSLNYYIDTVTSSEQSPSYVTHHPTAALKESKHDLASLCDTALSELPLFAYIPHNKLKISVAVFLVSQ